MTKTLQTTTGTARKGISTILIQKFTTLRFWKKMSSKRSKIIRKRILRRRCKLWRCKTSNFSLENIRLISHSRLWICQPDKLNRLTTSRIKAANWDLNSCFKIPTCRWLNLKIHQIKDRTLSFPRMTPAVSDLCHWAAAATTRWNRPIWMWFLVTGMRAKESLLTTAQGPTASQTRPQTHRTASKASTSTTRSIRFSTPCQTNRFKTRNTHLSQYREQLQKTKMLPQESYRPRKMPPKINLQPKSEESGLAP